MKSRRNPTAAVARLDSASLKRRGASSLVMGILNVTPDSFSDGGSYVQVDRAVARTFEMIQEGADIIDIGPESTRPGSKPVGAQAQIARAVPVIEAIRRERADVPISIDTRLAEVARAALDAGADWVNDVSALRDDPAMADLIATTGAPIVLMHRKGRSSDMQRGGGPHYDDVIAEIIAFLRERMDFAIGCGIDPQRIILDPGIGFGKRTKDNVVILQRIERFLALGKPLMLGASRKSFLAGIVEERQPCRRDAASIGCCVVALLAAQHAATAPSLILRVHDVVGTRQVVELCKALNKAQ